MVRCALPRCVPIRLCLISCEMCIRDRFITQPSLSQQIIKLEKELGVRLFERNGNTVILTKAGENFIKDAKQAILSFEQIKSDMECFRYAGKEHLRIGLMRSVQSVSYTHLGGEVCPFCVYMRYMRTFSGNHNRSNIR